MSDSPSVEPSVATGKLDVRAFSGAEQAAAAAAEFLVVELARAISERGHATLAVSGGSTPGAMLRQFAARWSDWEQLTIFQVDERVAPDGDPARNLSDLQAALAGGAEQALATIRPMPVTATDLTAACLEYVKLLENAAASPCVLDLVHLGLGEDGHTASLVPGDNALDVNDRDIAMTGAPYQGRPRMTMTYPLIARARRRLWLACGAGKVEAMRGLFSADPAIPAGRVPQANSIVFTDAAALGK